jgi:hypothetical protein
MVTVGAVIAVESANALPPLRDIAAVVIVILVYWLAHSYSTVMGRLYRSRRTWSWAEVRATLAREAAIMRGAGVPIVVMLLFELFGAPSAMVTWAGLATVLVLLVVFQGAAAQRAGMRGLMMLAQMGIGLSFGLALIGLKYVLP